MYVYDEKQFSGNNGVPFERYMYITADKFLSEHDGYDDYRFLICDGSNVYEYKDHLDDINVRKAIQKQYNEILKVKTGIDIETNASKMHMLLIDFEDDESCDDAYDFIKDAIQVFALKYNEVPIAMNTHFQQCDRYKHVHIIYPPNRVTSNALSEFINIFFLFNEACDVDLDSILQQNNN